MVNRKMLMLLTILILPLFSLTAQTNIQNVDNAVIRPFKFEVREVA